MPTPELLSSTQRLACACSEAMAAAKTALPQRSRSNMAQATAVRVALPFRPSSSTPQRAVPIALSRLQDRASNR
eukprot:1876093-Pleurochrysis_carterae.AAC.2